MFGSRGARALTEATTCWDPGRLLPARCQLGCEFRLSLLAPWFRRLSAGVRWVAARVATYSVSNHSVSCSSVTTYWDPDRLLPARCQLGREFRLSSLAPWCQLIETGWPRHDVSCSTRFLRASVGRCLVVVEFERDPIGCDMLSEDPAPESTNGHPASCVADEGAFCPAERRYSRDATMDPGSTPGRARGPSSPDYEPTATQC